MELKQTSHQYIRSISKLYTQNEVKASVAKVQAGARYISIAVHLIDPMKLTAVMKYAPFLQMNSGVENVIATQGTAKQRGRSIGVVWYQFELPKSAWRTVTRDDDNFPRSLGPVVGLSQAQRPVFYEHTVPNLAHTLFAGITGSGKTIAMKSALISLADVYQPDQMKVFIGDPKHVNFEEFDNWQALGHPLASQKKDIETIINRTYWEMLSRQKHGRTLGTSPDMQRWFLVLDECSHPFVLGDKHERHANMIGQIARIGREYGVHLILGIQEPNKNDMPFLNQLGARFSGLVSSAPASVLSTGKPGLAAHRLTGTGDFLYVHASNAVRFQVALPTQRNYNELPRGEILEQPELPLVENVPDYVPDKGGRPKNALVPTLAAKILLSRIKKRPLAIGAMCEKFGITKYNYHQHRRFVEDMIGELKRLRHA